MEPGWREEFVRAERRRSGKRRRTCKGRIEGKGPRWIYVIDLTLKECSKVLPSKSDKG